MRLLALAAVWNAGRAFPYIAGLVMCIGLIVHLFVRRKPEAKYKKVKVVVVDADVA